MIQVSNISDAFYLGIAQTLGCLAGMLQVPKKNPHATLITSFMNAVPEIMQGEGESKAAQKKRETEMKQASKFLKPLNQVTDMSMHMLQMTATLCHFGDFDAYFDK